MPRIHLFCLANELSFIKASNNKPQGQTISDHRRASKSKISHDLLSLIVCHFYSCKPRGRGLVLIFPLSEKSAWIWAPLPTPLSFLLSTAFLLCLLLSVFVPVKDYEWAGWKSQAHYWDTWKTHEQVEPQLCFVTGKVDAYFQKEKFHILELWAAPKTRI